MLRRAVAEERKSEATYRNVIARLGNVAPFVRIADSEATHVAELERVAAAHAIDVAGITVDGEPSPSTRAAACRLGVAAERADAALYDELLPKVADYPDVEMVFENLRAASIDNHLPAFERCA